MQEQVIALVKHACVGLANLAQGCFLLGYCCCDVVVDCVHSLGHVGGLVGACHAVSQGLHQAITHVTQTLIQSVPLVLCNARYIQSLEDFSEAIIHGSQSQESRHQATTATVVVQHARFAHQHLVLGFCLCPVIRVIGNRVTHEGLNRQQFGHMVIQLLCLGHGAGIDGSLGTQHTHDGTEGACSLARHREGRGHLGRQAGCKLPRTQFCDHALGCLQDGSQSLCIGPLHVIQTLIVPVGAVMAQDGLFHASIEALWATACHQCSVETHLVEKVTRQAIS